jgi:hypothetical protein
VRDTAEIERDLTLFARQSNGGLKVIGDEPANTDYDPGPSEKAVSQGEGRNTPRKRRLRCVIFSVCLAVKPVGEPDAGNPQVRFDERGWETERCRMAQATAPILDSTDPEAFGRPNKFCLLRYCGLDVLP